MRRVALRAVVIAVALAALLAGLALARPQAGTKKSGGSGHRTGAQSTSTATSPVTPTASAPVTVTVTTPAPTTTTPALTTTQPTTTTPAPTPRKAAKRKPPPPLSGLLGGGSLFPARVLVLKTPTAAGLDPSRVHVVENGVPVGGLTITQLQHPDPGDFGVVLVIDQSMSMSGEPLMQAMAAARAVAAQRTGSQQLGVVTFDQSPSVALALTDDAKTIHSTLASMPWVAPGARVQPALALAYSLLRRARIAAGAVILIADGVELSSNLQASAAAGQAPGVQLFTLGVRDQTLTASTRAALSRLGPNFTDAPPSKLPKILGGIWQQLANEQLVRYRSNVPFNRRVEVAARVDGVPGSVTLGYLAPPPPPPPRHVSPPPRHVSPAPAPAYHLPAEGKQPSTFWTSPLALLAVGCVCALLVGLGVMIVLSQVNERRRVRQRVATFIPNREQPAKAPFSQEAAAPGLLRSRHWWPAFVEQVAIARLERSPTGLVKLAGWVSLLAAVLLRVFSGSTLLALVGLAIGPVLLRVYVNRAVSRQRRRFAEQLPSHLQDLAGAMRAGRSIVGAISAVASSADQPIRGELDRALADERLGKPLEETLHAIARRMCAEDMDQFALIAALHRRSGSNVAEALDRVADGARQRADLTRELRALTSQAKVSSRVLTAIPPLLLVAIEVLDPAYAKPIFGSVLGVVVVGAGALMVLMGWMVMKRIVTVEA